VSHDSDGFAGLVQYKSQRRVTKNKALPYSKGPILKLFWAFSVFAIAYSACRARIRSRRDCEKLGRSFNYSDAY
jgi:hypothetical protein